MTEHCNVVKAAIFRDIKQDILGKFIEIEFYFPNDNVDKGNKFQWYFLDYRKNKRYCLTFLSMSDEARLLTYSDASEHLNFRLCKDKLTIESNSNIVEYDL